MFSVFKNAINSFQKEREEAEKRVQKIVTTAKSSVPAFIRSAVSPISFGIPQRTAEFKKDVGTATNRVGSFLLEQGAKLPQAPVDLRNIPQAPRLFEGPGRAVGTFQDRLRNLEQPQQSIPTSQQPFNPFTGIGEQARGVVERGMSSGPIGGFARFAAQTPAPEMFQSAGKVAQTLTPILPRFIASAGLEVARDPRKNAQTTYTPHYR